MSQSLAVEREGEGEGGWEGREGGGRRGRRGKEGREERRSKPPKVGCRISSSIFFPSSSFTFSFSIWILSG